MDARSNLSTALEEYLRGRAARYAKTTVSNERIVLERFVAWHGDVRIGTMTPERVAEWFVELRSPHVTRDRVHREPISATTHNYYATRLRAFFLWLTRRGALKVDLLAEVTPLRAKRRKRLQPPPSVLLDLPNHTTNARDRALVSLLINSGFRRGTALALRVQDIDLEDGWIFAQIKKSNAEDTFPISADLEPELTRWLRQYGKDLGRPLTGSEWLFPSRQGPRYHWSTQEDGTRVRSHTAPSWDSSRVMTHPERVVQAALRSAGVEIQSGEGTHTLRRAVARAVFDSLKADGHDHAIRQVSSLLHHQSTQVTEIYLGISAEVERRNALMRGKPLLSAMVAPKSDNVVSLR